MHDQGLARRLATPRWLGLTLVAVVLVAAFVLLGFWQLSRAQAFLGPRDDPAAVAVRTLSPADGQLPDEAVGRRVTATGTYDQAHPLLVADRGSGGGAGQGDWVVGLLRLDDGSGLLVVRGWVPSAADAPPLPTGPVTVSGRLAASEPADGGLPPGGTAAGTIAAVNPVDLLQVVPYQVHDGYLVATAQQPSDATALTAVRADPPGATVPGYLWQHVGYVGLWWLFAVFVVAFWVRLLRDDMGDDLRDDLRDDRASTPS